MFANVPFYQKIALSWQIIPVYIVIFEVTYCVNHYIFFDDKESTLKQTLSFLIFDPLAFQTVVTHVRSMFTNPGYVPIPYNPPQNISNTQDNANISKDDTKMETKSSELFCKKCNNPRPARSHHCKVCKKCTLKMDHHCHWIANCVGYYNQKIFYQFLFYATFGDAVGFLLLFTTFLNCDKNVKNNLPEGVKINSPFVLFYYMWTPIHLLISSLCALSMTFGIGSLFIKQTKMILNNQTTIEKKMYENWKSSPFYEENKMKNFKSVMGKSCCDWVKMDFHDENDPFAVKSNKKFNVIETN